MSLQLDLPEYNDNAFDSNLPFFIVDNNGCVKLSQTYIMQFLEESGFAKIYSESGIQFVRVKQNIIEKTDCNRIKDFIHLQINKMNERVKHQLLPQFYKCNIFKLDILSGLKTIDATYHCCTKSNSYLYFNNGYVDITADQYTLNSYSQMTGLLPKSKILQHDLTFTKAAYTRNHNIGDKPNHEHNPYAGEFEQMIDHQCNNEPQRILAHRSFIGYLCHSFKIPSEAKAIVLIDEKVSENPCGRSGKSLIGKAISYLKNTVEIAGRTFNTKNDFCYENVDQSTDLLFYNDLKPEFAFEDLYNIITDNIVINRKYSHAMSLNFQDSPKILITTNYIVNGQGESDYARRAEYEIHPWYTAQFSPASDFGHQLLLEWDQAEWNRFFIYIIECIQIYLKHGLIQVNLKNADQRRILQHTCRDFYEWAEDYFKDNNSIKQEIFKRPYTKEELITSFCTYSIEYKRKFEQGKFNNKTMIEWLRVFCACNNIGNEQVKRRIQGVLTPCVIFQIVKK